MPELVLPDQFRCAYPFKFCNNQRATKANGQPHKLCPEHRDRANKNQKNLAIRQRQLKERLQHASPSTRSIDNQLSFADISDLLDDNTFLNVECHDEDLKAVEELISACDSD